MAKVQLILQLLHPYTFILTYTVIREMRVLGSVQFLKVGCSVGKSRLFLWPSQVEDAKITPSRDQILSIQLQDDFWKIDQSSSVLQSTQSYVLWYVQHTQAAKRPEWKLLLHSTHHIDRFGIVYFQFKPDSTMHSELSKQVLFLSLVLIFTFKTIRWIKK